MDKISVNEATGKGLDPQPTPQKYQRRNRKPRYYASLDPRAAWTEPLPRPKPQHELLPGEVPQYYSPYLPMPPYHLLHASTAYYQRTPVSLAYPYDPIPNPTFYPQIHPLMGPPYLPRPQIELTPSGIPSVDLIHPSSARYLPKPPSMSLPYDYLLNSAWAASSRYPNSHHRQRPQLRSSRVARTRSRSPPRREDEQLPVRDQRWWASENKDISDFE